MIVRIVLWAIFLGALLFAWSKEVLAFQESRRSGQQAPREAFARFRRRTLGLAVLFLLGLFYDLSNVLPFPSNREELIWYGVCFILLIWLILIVLRDVRAVSESYAQLRRDVTLETLQEVQRRTGGGVTSPKAAPPDGATESDSPPGPR